MLKFKLIGIYGNLYWMDNGSYVIRFLDVFFVGVIMGFIGIFVILKLF